MTLQLPRHNPLDPGYDEAISFKNEIDIDSAKIYLDENSISIWRKAVVSYRSWRFNGPMFTGKLGDVSYSMVIYNCRYTEGETLFNPAQLEKELFSLLTTAYSEEKFRWAQNWEAPLNWKAHSKLDVDSVSYDIHHKIKASFYKEFVFPVTNDSMVIISFRQMLLSGTPGYDRARKLVDRTPMEKLCNDIIDSLNISLSDESQQQRLDAQQAYPGAKLSEEIAPLKWTTEEEDEKHAYYLSHRDEF